ncbi:MAG: lipid A deacylase LpxR family protein [Alphaproteobacteria bacterium]
MMWKTCRGVLLILGIVASAVAEEQILTLTSENDLYTYTGDAYYTNGMRASWLDASFRPPAFAEALVEQIPWMNSTAPMLVNYSIGQSMFTPPDITIAAPQPAERPWAGFLYGTMGLAQGNRDVVDELELTVGWVGPGAMAEQAQEFIHNLWAYRTPKGWDNQLDDEPALNLALQRRWPTFGEVEVIGTAFYLSPHIGAAVGNVDTHAAVGATLRWDSDASAVVDNPLRVRPAPAGTGYFQTPQTPVFSLFVGGEGRAVAHNIFLDGNTFGSSPCVRKKNVVADVQAGMMLTYKRFQVGYTAVYRMHEFFGQKNGQVFGAVSLAVKF